MKKLIFKSIICVFIITTISVITFLIPRNNTLDKFKTLEYGDSFIITMLKLGKPSIVSEGGIGLLNFGYKLEDDSIIYLTFGKKLTILKTCGRYKNSKIIEIYVSNPYLQRQ